MTGDATMPLPFSFRRILPSERFTTRQGLATFAGLVLFHFLLSTAFILLAKSAWFADYHYGNGLWVFAGDSYAYHNAGMEGMRALEQGIYTDWWNPPSGFWHVKLIAVAYYLFGPDPLAYAPVNALVWAGCVTLVYRSSLRLFPDAYAVAVVVALLFGLWPTHLVHSMQLLRESFYLLGGLSLFYAGIGLATRTDHYSDLLALVAGVYLVFVIRPYLVTVFLALIVVAALFSLIRDRRRWVTPVLALLIVIGGQWYLSHDKAERIASIAKRNVVIDQVMRERVEGAKAAGIVSDDPREVQAFREKEHRDIVILVSRLSDEEIEAAFLENRAKYDAPTASSGVAAIPGGGTAYADSPMPLPSHAWKSALGLPAPLDSALRDVAVSRDGFFASQLDRGGGTLSDGSVRLFSDMEVIGYFPRAAVSGLFAPFPDDWFAESRTVGFVGRLVVAGEMAALYVLYFGYAFFLIRSDRGWQEKVWILLFHLSFVTLLGLVVTNAGALHRMRILYLAPVVITGVYGLSQWYRAAKRPLDR
jgi:hypothetical protein